MYPLHQFFRFKVLDVTAANCLRVVSSQIQFHLGLISQNILLIKIYIQTGL